MSPNFQYGKNWIVLKTEQSLAKVRYVNNRFNFNPNVYRLLFNLYPNALGNLLPQDLHALLAEVQRLLPKTALLCRTTVEASSPLLPMLKDAGFLETRYVYEPLLELENLELEVRSQLEEGSSSYVLRPLRDADIENPAFLDLHKELYARTSRMDPATPERVSKEEWMEVLQEDLNLEYSVCLVENRQIVGLALVYNDAYEVPKTYQLGILGIRQDLLKHHQPLSVAMVENICIQLKDKGEKFLRAEMDADDPWVFYTCAAFPFRHDKKSVSLAWPLQWATSRRSEET